MPSGLLHTSSPGEAVLPAPAESGLKHTITKMAGTGAIPWGWSRMSSMEARCDLPDCIASKEEWWRNMARNCPNRTSPKPSYTVMISNVITILHSYNGADLLFLQLTDWDRKVGENT